MAKPMLATFPFLLLLLDIWPLRRWGKFAPYKSASTAVGPADVSLPFARTPVILEKIPLLAISTIFSAMAIISQRGAGNVAGLPTQQ